MPGRRQEPGRRPARRRHGHDHEDRRRLGVRLRRPALPRVVGRHHRGRRREAVHAADQRRGRVPQGRLRPRGGHRDGPGDLRREPRTHRRADRAGHRRRRASRSWTAATPRCRGYERGNFVRPTVLADVDPASELARTEIFGPVLSVMRADTRRGRDRAGQRLGLRQHGVPVHQQRLGRAPVPLRGAGRQRRHQRRRGRADGLLPVLGLEGQLLRRPARAGARRHRLLHREEGRRRALARDVEPEVLAAGLASRWLRSRVWLFPPSGIFAKRLRLLLQPLRLSLGAAAGAELGSGDEILDGAISPDEGQIVFVATTDGTAALWRRTFNSEQAAAIANTDGARLPAWKQTGNVVSFFAGERLKQVNINDGTVRDLADASDGSGASWLLDGSLLFARDARGSIRRLLNGAVSDTTTLRPGDRSHTFPMTVGSTNSFVYVATLDDGRRMLRLVENGQERDLGTTSGHGQIVGDALLHVRDGVLLSQRLDPETRQPFGNSTPLALDVGTARPATARLPHPGG